MENTEASFDNTLPYFDEQSQNTEVYVAAASEEECDVRTGESSVDGPAQGKTAGKHFKCDICCKSFVSKTLMTEVTLEDVICSFWKHVKIILCWVSEKMTYGKYYI